MVYRLPRLIDVNAKSRLFRGSGKLLILGRCVETEHPDILGEFLGRGYAALTVCLEAEHINMVGFKLAGILARGDYEEVAVLTVDGSPHCTQLHWMVEETFKVTRYGGTRRHYVINRGRLVEVSPEAVKTSRYLARVEALLRGRSGGE